MDQETALLWRLCKDVFVTTYRVLIITAVAGWFILKMVAGGLSHFAHWVGTQRASQHSELDAQVPGLGRSGEHDHS
jgi:phosphotransferase system  glucose/maltose/N-acetylglucosamine-specific IIC component